MKKSLLSLSCLLLTSCGTLPEIIDSGAQITEAVYPNSKISVSQGVREIMSLSSINAATYLSEPGAYFNSIRYRITMPSELQDAVTLLRQFGYEKQVNKTEMLMNQAAEQAARAAAEVFGEVIRNITIEEAMSIVRGHSSAATDYLKSRSYTELAKRYRPIIDANLSELGFYNHYRSLLEFYNKLPLASKPSLDLQQHVLDKSLGGLFIQMAEEEAKIRRDPFAWSNKVISTVFGS